MVKKLINQATISKQENERGTQNFQSTKMKSFLLTVFMDYTKNLQRLFRTIKNLKFILNQAIC